MGREYAICIIDLGQGMALRLSGSGVVLFEDVYTLQRSLWSRLCGYAYYIPREHNYSQIPKLHTVLHKSEK